MTGFISQSRLYDFSYREWRTYAAAVLFTLGNIAVPQFVHLIPGGGPVWLPIYFFTLVGAYKYGLRVGLLTALASPIINSALFGMPDVAVLPSVLLKSVTLALLAGFAASRFKDARIWQLLIVILGYQLIGSLGEWLLSGSVAVAMQDFRLGIPGLLTQLIGAWLLLHFGFRDSRSH